VGLERKTNDINKLLQKVRIVSLVGMGGIGKTTLSKKVYHLFHNKYDKFSFLEDVKSKQIEDVQKQLLKDLCGRKMTKEEDINDDDLDSIRNCMIFERVLVVVDDVGTTENLKALQVLAIEGKQNVIISSNVIVTCRNWQVLEGHVSANGKMDVAPLNMEGAKELFLFQAFRITKVVKEGFEVIFDEIVQACDGLPLSLEIMGGFLHTKQQLEIWKDVLQRLRNAEALDGGKDDKLWRSLQISYEDLQPTERNMFLDIACYFCGLNEQMITQIWDSQSSPQLGLRNLKDRSLVKLSENGNLVVHDQLRDMGRKFATVQQKTRLWDSKKESFQCLQHKKVIITIPHGNRILF
jgi:energy-coupling factor transporter ATP-binding protein EcfA2